VGTGGMRRNAITRNMEPTARRASAARQRARLEAPGPGPGRRPRGSADGPHRGGRIPVYFTVDERHALPPLPGVVAGRHRGILRALWRAPGTARAASPRRVGGRRGASGGSAIACRDAALGAAGGAAHAPRPRGDPGRRRTADSTCDRGERGASRQGTHRGRRRRVRPAARAPAAQHDGGGAGRGHAGRERWDLSLSPLAGSTGRSRADPGDHHPTRSCAAGAALHARARGPGVPRGRGRSVGPR
jgi:hypothetical protein